MVDQTEPEFPPVDLPCIFSDGAMNAARGRGIVKFYLARIDTPFSGAGGALRPAAQIVMPIDGFVAMVELFNHAIEGMVADGQITAERVAELRQMQRQETA